MKMPESMPYNLVQMRRKSKQLRMGVVQRMELKSMTGFGRAEANEAAYRITVELKSVNSRFLDLNIKMPKKLNALEAQIRGLVKQYVARGKADLYITCEEFTDQGQSLRLNLDLAEEYYASLQKIAETLGVENRVTAMQLANFPEVLKLSEESEDDGALWERLQPVLEAALQQFVANRELEGANLRVDLLQKLDSMEEIVGRIEARAPEITAAYEKRLRERVEEMLGTTADPQRIVQEVTIYADKVCTDEELVRLRSHISNMRKKLQAGGAVGRELDFLAQEMNREANTTLSKANDIIVSDDAINLKTLIEKIREQVQNIE